ncbi:hypothetical protein BKA82DRAFT_4108531 [Pisolithus tinctorius]|nr:hypothetical protein BKA82DRAFT_4108531 [Pisolithus tinctorius]
MSRFAMHRPLVGFILFMSWLSLASAQFGFFDQLFGNQQQQRGSSGGQYQYNVHVDSISCSTYLCPDSLVCVAQPSECPCPYAEDVRCVIPDLQDGGAAGTVACVRGTEGCSVIERLASPFSR